MKKQYFNKQKDSLTFCKSCNDAFKKDPQTGNTTRDKSYEPSNDTIEYHD